MADKFFVYLDVVDRFYWSYIGAFLVFAAGLYFTIKSKGFQFTTISDYKAILKKIVEVNESKLPGINPIKLYFASLGGMMGLGNIVIIITSVRSGGPGVLLWLWVAAFAGMLIKYAEIYLGVKYRIVNNNGRYIGGPMFYLQSAFKSKKLPIVTAILLCIYGVEVSQFKTITDTFARTYNLDQTFVALVILLAIIYSGVGGVKRLANICSVLMPPFMILYTSMCLYVIYKNSGQILPVMQIVLKSAFVGHAPVAGFAGSTLIMAIQYGVARAVYSGDIAIGYDSVMQSETRSKNPMLQAKMTILAQLTDTIMCSLSILVVLVTGIWSSDQINDPSVFVLAALSKYFSHADIFMSILFFLAGFATIIAYFTAGVRSAKFVNRPWGKNLFIAYAIISLLSTLYVDQNNLINVMSLAGGVLVLINILAILKLRSEIKFNK